MKTSIVITGSGISSKHILLSYCSTIDSELKKLMFNNYELLFNSKKEATRALSEAYRCLKSYREDWEASCGAYCYGSSLDYDAGNARITKTE